MKSITKINFNGYENIIFNFGMVDAVPRTMGQRFTKFVNYVRPIFLRNIYLKYINQNRKIILENQTERIFYTNIGKFEILFRQLLNFLPKNKNILFVNITNEEEKVNTIVSSVRIYNQAYNLIINLAKEYEYKIFDLYEMSTLAMNNNQNIFYDGIHYNEVGHTMIFNELVRYIK